MSEIIRWIENTIQHLPQLWGAALAAAIASTVATLRSGLSDWIVRRAKLRASRTAAFVGVMASSDLEAIAAYLFSTLGQFTIAEYARRDTVHERVDQMIQRLQSFVGTTAEVSAASITESNVAVPATETIPFELNDVHRNLEAGEQWNALAALRRQIEMLLRSIARGSGIDISNRMSAGQLAAILRGHGVISVNTEALLRSAIAVANRAVHGLDVPREDAERAIRAAATALEMVKRESRSA